MKTTFYRHKWELTIATDKIKGVTREYLEKQVTDVANTCYEYAENQSRFVFGYLRALENEGVITSAEALEILNDARNFMLDFCDSRYN